MLALTRTLNGTAEADRRARARWRASMSSNCCARLERRPLSGGGDFRRGRTPFEKLTADLPRSRTASPRVEDMQLEGADGPARARRLGLDPGARSRSARDRRAGFGHAADAPPAFELPFVVQGPWDDPIMLPDAQSLIRRSPAARPLLERGARPQHPRRRALGDRTADRRRHQPRRRRAGRAQA